MCSAQSFTSSEGRGENLINHHLRRGDSALTAKLHFLKMKTTWSQLRGCIDEVPQLKLNSTYRDGQLCSLFFFFFSQSVKLCQLFYFKFFPTKLKNFWIASQLSFSIERHVSFQLSFQGLWFIFARVISNETCFTYCLQCCLLMQREDCSNICNRFHLCICKPCVKMWNTKKARWACWGLTW